MKGAPNTALNTLRGVPRLSGHVNFLINRDLIYYIRYILRVPYMLNSVEELPRKL
jgi:hypothetical protein